LIRCTR